MKVYVLNHKSRDCSKIKDVIKKSGHEPIVHTDHSDYKNSKNRLEKYIGLNKNVESILATPWDENFKLVIQDDVSISENTIDIIEVILKQAPVNNPVAFYNPSNNLFESFKASGKRVMKSKVNAWGQCLAFPKRWAMHYMSWVKNNIEEIGYYGDDQLFGIFNEYTDNYYYIVQPSLFKHNGLNASTFGHPAKVGKRVRNTSNYSNELNDFDIYWPDEFVDPYIDPQQKTGHKKYIKCS